MNKLLTVLLIALVIAPVVRSSTPDTVTVPNDFGLGTINNVIQGDTNSNGTRVNPLRVYKLLRGGYYTLNGTITTNPGTHIWIVGEDAPATGTDPGMPIIIEGDVTGLYYFQTIDSYGDLTMKNIWLIYATQLGTQNWTTLQFEQDNTKAKSRGEFTNCIFDYVNAVAVMAHDTGFTGIFKNCIFRNSIDPGQWWAGRMFATYDQSARVDTIWSENCTYENQGFSYQSDYTPPKFVFYNHNTFLNIAKFPFKFYWMTHLICTNNIFVNCHFTGERYQDRIGQDQDVLLYGAVLDVDTMDVNGGLPGTLYNGVLEKDRVVYFYNNSNYTDPMFQTFYNTYNDTATGLKGKILPEPIMNDRTIDMFTWHQFMKLDPNYQALDGQNPQFTTPGTNADSIIAFLKARYATGGSVFWAYNPDLNGTWPLKENLAYSNSTLLTAATGGRPLGDLYHWFPSQYASWSAQAATEDNTIIGKSVSGVKQVSDVIPESYTLQQNYPNPFNPATRIDYSLAKRGSVTLKVYNVVGQEVATLFSGVQEAGRYEASFDAKTLSSGVYLYRLQAGNTTITKKMMLLK